MAWGELAVAIFLDNPYSLIFLSNDSPKWIAISNRDPIWGDSEPVRSTLCGADQARTETAGGTLQKRPFID
jgi:hypothetical protein